MDAVTHVMSTPWVGPGIIAALSVSAAWVMVYFQHKRHSEDFQEPVKAPVQAPHNCWDPRQQ